MIGLFYGTIVCEFVESRGALWKLKIIETSDMHGYVLPTNYTERNMDLGFSTAKAATVIQSLKARSQWSSNSNRKGDFIQGSPLSY